MIIGMKPVWANIAYSPREDMSRLIATVSEFGGEVVMNKNNASIPFVKTNGHGYFCITAHFPAKVWLIAFRGYRRGMRGGNRNVEGGEQTF